MIEIFNLIYDEYEKGRIKFFMKIFLIIIIFFLIIVSYKYLTDERNYKTTRVVCYTIEDINFSNVTINFVDLYDKVNSYVESDNNLKTLKNLSENG